MAKKTKKGPKPFIKERLSAVRAAMAEHDIEAFLVTNRFDGFYLTGFTGEDSAVLIMPRAVHVFTDGRFETSSAAEVGWARIHFRKNSINEKIGEVAGKLGLKTIHIQPEVVTLATKKDLRKHCRPTKLAEAPNLVGDLRILKDSEEVRQINKAIKVAQDAFLAMRETIKVGQTEQDMAARLEYEMARRGSTGCAFPSIVAIGPNAALPHAVPGTRKVKKGSAILFDWGAITNFYRSDLTRMVFVATIPPKIRKIYDVVLEAQLKAIDAIKPGERMCDIDGIARDHIKKAGFGDYFGHSLGHGVGLDIHEAPRLSYLSDQELQPGMVVTVEPGIYLPRVGGVRIEDDVLVTPRGHKVLSSLTKTIEEAVI